MRRAGRNWAREARVAISYRISEGPDGWPGASSAVMATYQFETTYLAMRTKRLPLPRTLVRPALPYGHDAPDQPSEPLRQRREKQAIAILRQASGW